MNNIPAQQKPQHEERDPTSRVIYGVGMALFLFGIFIPGAHTLMMVGMALLALAYAVRW